MQQYLQYLFWLCIIDGGLFRKEACGLYCLFYRIEGISWGSRIHHKLLSNLSYNVKIKKSFKSNINDYITCNTIHESMNKKIIAKSTKTSSMECRTRGPQHKSLQR